MSAATEDITDRERTAFDRVKALEELPERCSGEPSEREAARRVGAWMEQAGATRVEVRSVPGRARSGARLAVHMGLAALGCWVGGLLGAVLALAAAASMGREEGAHQPGLSRWLPAPPSVNVAGRLGSAEPQRRIVLSAHIDAAQAGLLFHPGLADFFARNAGEGKPGAAPPAGPYSLPRLLIHAAVFLTLASWLGASGPWLGLSTALVGALLAVSALLGVEWAWSAASPGANDNASAVAAMLTCAEVLAGSLPDDVELWMVGTGAEEVGCVGIRGFLDAHPDWTPETTWFVNFECVGGGRLHYVASEGSSGKTAYPPQLQELARRVSAGGGFGEVSPTHLMAGTDGHVPAQHGYPTLSLISLEANGVPRNYHRPEDIAENLDLAMIVRAADFGAAVVQAGLAGASDPIPSPGR